MIMKYRAILHNVKSGAGKIESVWVEEIEVVNRVGEEGLKLYGGTHFTVESKET